MKVSESPVAKLDVNLADLLLKAQQYTDLSSRTADIVPRAVAEVQRVLDTHGPMGYPAALGIATGLEGRGEDVVAKAVDFTGHSTRLSEHGATYQGEDSEAAQRYGAGKRDGEHQGEERRSGVQAASYDVPLSPADTDVDLPHGKDPRYWLDTSKLIHVADGELAPYGTKQVGPNLYYPFNDSSYRVTPPPSPAEFPFDASRTVIKGPGELGPFHYDNLGTAPDGRTAWYPRPFVGEAVPAPQQAIDVRDVINVPEGVKAPWGYIEYLPGWWAPGHIPSAR